MQGEITIPSDIQIKSSVKNAFSFSPYVFTAWNCALFQEFKIRFHCEVTDRKSDSFNKED